MENEVIFAEENKSIEWYIEFLINEFYNNCKENNIIVHKIDKFKKLQLMR